MSPRERDAGDMALSNKALATSLALLAGGSAAATPALLGVGGTSPAQAADAAAFDDLTDDGTQPAPPPAPEPGPAGFDDLTNEAGPPAPGPTQPPPGGTTPPTPGPTPPSTTPPVPGSCWVPAGSSSSTCWTPSGTAPAPGSSSLPAPGTSTSPSTAPNRPASRRTRLRLTLTVSRRHVTHRLLRRGLPVRL